MLPRLSGAILSQMRKLAFREPCRWGREYSPSIWTTAILNVARVVKSPDGSGPQPEGSIKHENFGSDCR